jgi:hypothetical protein
MSSLNLTPDDSEGALAEGLMRTYRQEMATHARRWAQLARASQRGGGLV